MGAGLAGLTCAYRLHLHGVGATVYEAADRVGGRCWSARDFADGQVAEHGGEFIDAGHGEILGLVRELGLEVDDLGAAARRQAGAEALLYIDGERRRSSETFSDFPVVLEQLEADAERIGDYRCDRASDAARGFDQLSVQDWIDANVPSGGGSLLGRALGIWMTSLFGLQCENLSAINLFFELFVSRPRRLGTDKGDPPDAYDPVDQFVAERYHVRGGNDQVVYRMAEHLPPGSIRLDAPLEAMWRRRDRGYGLRFGDSSGDVVADRVVLALPLTSLRRVDLDRTGLTERHRECIEKLGMGKNAKLLMQFSDPFPSHDGWNGCLLTDDPMCWSWDSSLAQPGDAGVLTIFTGGDVAGGHRPNRPHGEASESAVRDALATIDRLANGFGGKFNGRAWLDSWVDDPWVRGSYTAFEPGQFTRYFGFVGRAEGGVHFAGEHTSTTSWGYLNGAVESGERCAQEVLSALGLP